MAIKLDYLNIKTMTKKYDLGGALKGNGLTIFNRAEELGGDYKNIAHISDRGEITYYSNSLPQEIKDQVKSQFKPKK